MTAERVTRIASIITDFWPHRMSGRAAEAIDRSYLSGMAAEVAEVNEANGWYEDERTFGDDIALLHSEVSEALEAWRDHGFDDATRPLRDVYTGEIDPNKTPKPEGVGSELADVLIRLLDTAHRRGIDLHAEYVRKVAYNRTRGHKHGGKRI